MNQIEEIKQADRAFIVPINKAIRSTLIHRYQVYLQNKNKGTFPIFFSEEKSKLKHQVKIRTEQNLPLMHFAVKGKDQDNVLKIAKELRKINETLPVHYLNGF